MKEINSYTFITKPITLILLRVTSRIAWYRLLIIWHNQKKTQKTLIGLIHFRECLLLPLNVIQVILFW